MPLIVWILNIYQAMIRVIVMQYIVEFKFINDILPAATCTLFSLT